MICMSRFFVNRNGILILIERFGMIVWFWGLFFLDLFCYFIVYYMNVYGNILILKVNGMEKILLVGKINIKNV